MKISQTYRADLIAAPTIDSTPRKPNSGLRGLMHRLGAAFVACTLVIAATGTARAAQAQNEAAVRALGDGFAKAFLQKNADARASLFADNGTFVTPAGRLSARPGRNGEGLRFGGGRGQRLHASGVLQLPPPLHQTRCCSRGRAAYPTQCQRSGWNDHPRDPGQLFLRGRPPRRSLADRGWARAFRTRAA